MGAVVVHTRPDLGGEKGGAGMDRVKRAEGQ
jgi:hypothetical protein